MKKELLRSVPFSLMSAFISVLSVEINGLSMTNIFKIYPLAFPVFMTLFIVAGAWGALFFKWFDLLLHHMDQIILARRAKSEGANVS